MSENFPNPVGNKSENPWKPGRDFFASNPRSREIREACVAIVKKVEALEASDLKDEEEKARVYAELERLNGKLIELGVRENMNVGKSEESYKSDPVFAAEYFAGQIMFLTGEAVPAEAEIRPGMGEHGESAGDIRFVEAARLSEKAAVFHLHAAVLAMARHYFDISSEELA